MTYRKVGVVTFIVGIALSASAATADTNAVLQAGPSATPKEAVSIQDDSNLPYYGLAAMAAGAAGYFTSQGDGTVGGCIGLPGCTSSTTTSTPTTTTKTTTTTTTSTRTR